MIVRNENNTLLLITQHDHAQLASEIVMGIRSEPILSGPDRDTVLLATREHDNGWHEVDIKPSIDPKLGHPYNFTSGPVLTKLQLWPRGISRVAQVNSQAGALVAEHALTVYRDRRDDPEWKSFFKSIATTRDTLLKESKNDLPNQTVFKEAYRCVRLGDLLSLHFCAGWTSPQEVLGYRTELHKTTQVITPDPFDGASVPLQVIARRIPARRYLDDAELQSALNASNPEFLIGTAHGK